MKRIAEKHGIALTAGERLAMRVNAWTTAVQKWLFLQYVGKRFLRFLVVGGLNTALNYGIYALLIFVGLGYIAAATLSFVAGLVISFKTHSRFVFDGRGNRAFLPYVASWLAIYLAHITTLGFLVRSGMNSYLAGAILVPPVAVISFLVMRFVVFRGRTAPKDA
jgi:putative flippase GtrA